MLVVCNNPAGYEGHLTKDKKYKLIREEEGILPINPYYVLTGDKGEEVWARKNRFLSLDEYIAWKELKNA